MELIPVLKYPVGTRATVLVHIDQCMDDHLFGTEIPFGTPIAYPNEGVIEEGTMTLYNVRRTGMKLHDAWVLSPVPGFQPLKHRSPVPADLGFVHDTCCGLGGFATGLDFLHNACGVPGQVVTAVDLCPLAMSAYCRNHNAFPISGDVCSQDTIFQMHAQQIKVGAQPLLVGDEFFHKGATPPACLACTSLKMVRSSGSEPAWFPVASDAMPESSPDRRRPDSFQFVASLE